MKNTPITARVKSGMFKTKEPLLNVGPAGVDGNNKTRTMPSPSKMKGYSMKSSPFKQAEKNVKEATASEASLVFDGKGGAGGVMETTERIPGEAGTPDTVIQGNSGSDAFKSAFADARKSGAKTFNFKGDSYSTELSKDPNFGKDKVVKGKSGTPDKVVKTKVKGDTYRKSEGDAQSAYNRRQNIRSSKVTGRQKKRQTIKKGRLTDKLAGIDKEKNPGKYRRIKAKLDQATDRLDVATSEAANVKNQSQQNIKAGSNRSVRGTDVKNTAADWDKNTQIKNLDSGATKSAFTPKEVNTDIGFEARNVKSGFFKKKSPMKMNYFKK